MDGQRYKKTGRQTDRVMDKDTVDRPMDGRTGIQIDRQTHEQGYKQTNRDRRIDGQQ